MDMSTSREVDRSWSETKAGVSSLFAVVTEEKVLQMLTFLECVVLSLNLYMLIQLCSIHFHALHFG